VRVGDALGVSVSDSAHPETSEGAYLGVRADVVEHAGDAAEALVELVTLLQRVRYSLQDLLVLLAVRVLHLLRRLDIVFQIANGVLPGRQAFCEQLGDLRTMSLASTFKTLHAVWGIVEK